jgi:hypothetical protein
MGWQAGDDSGPGGAPGPDGGLPGLLAGFEHGGGWERAAPSAALAAALEAAAGAGGAYEGAGAGALVGVARQWAAVESWAAAGLLGALRSMMRENGEGRPLLRRDLGLPEGWDDSLGYELAAALAMGPVSAANLAGLAWTLGTRLPGIGRLLADGVLTRAKARLIARTFEPLSDQEAARAEALVLGELAGKTWFQVERLAWRAALAVAPDAAGRRRAQAEKRRARVTVFREESGAVGLSGRDLPAAQALAGHASVAARAEQYQASGAFPGHTLGTLQALAFVHLLNDVSVADAIAFARTPDAEPPAAAAPDDDSDDGGGPWPGDDGEPGGHGPDPGDLDDDEPDNDPDNETGPDDDDPGGGPKPGGGAADEGSGRGRGRNDPPGGDGGSGEGGPDEDPDSGPGPGGSGPQSGAGGAGCPAVLPEVTVPLATLQGRAERAGENRLLGPLDPAQARELALAAARSPHSTWEVTIVDERGYAIGHGLARPGRGRRQGPQPPGPPGPPGSPAFPLPAWVNITITQTLLRELAAHAPPTAPPRPGAPPGDWALIPRPHPPADDRPGDHGTWTLTLPGGRELAVRFDVVPTHACDHRYQAGTYQPGDRLRRLVQVRDHECTFPTCSRPARESDFEHAVPYDKGGKTDACNAGARSRRCHQVKQSPGWKVTQPKPGWHVWTTPTGRAYTQEPWRYIA